MKVTKIVGILDNRLPLIYDQWIIKKNIENAKNRKLYDPTWFHASQVSTARCLVELYWGVKALDTPNNFPLNVLRIFKMGDSVHERIQTAFKEMGILSAEDEEKKFYIPEYNICGRTDGIVFIKPDPEGFILEIKSISEKGYEALTKPKKEHIIQNMLYQKGFNILRGFVMYENKNNQEQKCYYLEYNEEVIKDKLDMCKQAIEILKTDELPEGFKCRYIGCQFGMNCKKTFFEKNKNELKGKEESDIVVIPEKHDDNIFPQSDEGDVF